MSSHFQFQRIRSSTALSHSGDTTCGMKRVSAAGTENETVLHVQFSIQKITRSAPPSRTSPLPTHQVRRSAPSCRFGAQTRERLLASLVLLFAGTVVPNAIAGTYDESRAVFTGLERLGVSYDDVVKVLEDEGVSKFADSWADMLSTIKSQLQTDKK